MYQLLVFYPGERLPHTTTKVAKAADVLELISTLLAEHGGCERVVVMNDGVRLFAVDCMGNRLP